MAYLCPRCHRVHPKGLEGPILCEMAKKEIERRGEEMRMRIIAHREVCDCADAQAHLEKRGREKKRGKGLFDNRPFGAKV